LSAESAALQMRVVFDVEKALKANK